MHEENFDVFISYAKEDEAEASRIAGQLGERGLRVFFAPQQFRGDESDAQERLHAALKRSRNILLLWSKWVDKSEWVAFETSVFATDRAILKNNHDQGLAILDLNGPPVPLWLPHDTILQSPTTEELARLFQTPLWWSSTKHSPLRQSDSPGTLWNSLSIAREVLFLLPAWNARVRRDLLRVGPMFSISHLRPEDIAQVGVARLIRDALTAVLLWNLVITVIAVALWAWVLPSVGEYAEYQGYVPRATLISCCASLAIALVLSLRVGVAAGVAGGLIGGLCGTITGIVTAYFLRPDSWAGGVAAGSALAAASAIAMQAHKLSTQRHSARSRNWTPVVAVMVALGLVALGQTIAQWWAASNQDPTLLERTIFAGELAALVFAPIGAIAGWFAHLQVRFRHWRKAMTIGILVWIGFVVIAAAAAAAVPFGNPFDPRDGVGVGLIAGAVGAGLVTIIAEPLVRRVGDAASTPAATALLLAIGYPILRLFPNVQAGAIYFAVCVSAIATFLTFSRGKPDPS